MDNTLTKISLQGLNRLDVEAYKQAQKLPVTFVLDDIRSGLNVGSIFRTADAFALQSLFLCGITAQPPHREILNTALGSTESVDWRYSEDIEAALQTLRSQGFFIWAVEQTTGADLLHHFLPETDQPHAFIFGNEVNGVAEKALALCNGAIEIPQYGTKHSLNVAVAAGILAWACNNWWRTG